MANTRSRRFLGVPDEFWIAFVIIVGFFLKLVYNIEGGYIPGTVNPGVWTEITEASPNSGHIGLIQYYFTFHKLAGFDPRTLACYSNPPFYYMTGALFLEFTHRMMNWDIGIALHALQCVNVIYVLIGESMGIGILQKMGVRGRKMMVCILFLIFFPTYYLIGASLDPTAMTFMFTMLSLNTALSWFNSRRNSTLRALAIQLGLGLMTSFRLLMIIPPILILLFRAAADGRRNATPLHRQFRNAAIITSVLGLWWPIYRLIRFRVPLFYMDKPYGEMLQERFSARLRPPTLAQLSHLHTVNGGYRESNIWAQTFKTAVVDFHSLDVSTAATRAVITILLVITILICIISHIMLVYTLLSNRLDRVYCRFIAVGYLSMLGFYLLGCWRYPYTGMMNFKTIAPILIFPLIGTGLCGTGDSQDNVFEKMLEKFIGPLLFMMSVLSAFLFGYYY
ncbi:MAG: hypothetical protein Q4B09_07625 [Lachnospiraceae bacterium]|nr:hypothetical protein [Lachnospiraceae bacterium]